MLQKPLTEEDAYTALVKGEARGLDYFFNRYYTPLTFYAASIINDKEVAKEIAAEAFVKLWAKREGLEEGRQVRLLLYRIVHNLSLNVVRDKKGERKGAAQLRSVTPASEHPYLDSLIEGETISQLYRLLQTLPPRARQIFWLFYYQKQSVKQIAAELNISVNTVKTQKLRAIQALKAQRDVLYLFIIYSLIFI